MTNYKFWHITYWDDCGEELKYFTSEPCPIWLSSNEVQKSVPATVENTSLDDMIDAVGCVLESANHHYNPGIRPLVYSVLSTTKRYGTTKEIIFNYLSHVGLELGLDK